MLLTSCEKQNNAKRDVSRFVKTLENVSSAMKPKDAEKGEVIAPVFYDGDKHRDPFELPASVKNVKQYPNTILVEMPLDSLKLIGIVFHKNLRWAVFRGTNGRVYKMTEGMRVGTQHALLTEIQRSQIKFTVDVNTEAGVTAKEVVMTLQEPS
ncbi:MAG: hypothetical protein A3F13_04565 [Gammaproteobacteria bacterium RIFCSPHIGHO2_12_FULL_40_19]|nr:MAG: hypothetical protein A3F13_04565 [Gammaproteobacteria bacterium RIFCSPHIGHO2_12_FULL_40_19]